MAGPASSSALAQFVETLRILNPRAKVLECEDNIDKLGINFMNDRDTEKQLIDLRNKGLMFADQLNQMKPSLRFSILALLSQNKFNIFNHGLIDFMEMLNNGGWNKCDKVADFGAYLIDQINMFKNLDFKDDSGAYIQ